MATNKSQQNGLHTEQAAVVQETFIEKYKNQLIIGLIALVVVVGGAFAYRTYVYLPKENKASEALYKNEQLFSRGEFDKALNGDGKDAVGFLQVIDEFGSTKAGNLAELYAGMCYAQLGKYEEAAKYLESYDQADDALISPAAVGMLGNCYAQLNQLDKATATLTKAAKMADNNALSPSYLLQAGIIYESQGNKEKALECYKTIKEKYIRSVQYGTIDKYIERVSE
ncbi:MAG: tetratricopeptide repeat protein [Clostridium sp.]|nr:tetratricopeptide repeat protein [Clostridium sp.]